MFSASPSNSDIARCSRHFAFVPNPDITDATNSQVYVPLPYHLGASERACGRRRLRMSLDRYLFRRLTNADAHSPSRLPSEELDTGHCRLHRAVPVDAIRPFPKHCLQGGGNILRPGCIGCMTFGNPVPSHAGHSTSGTLGLRLFIKNLS